MSNLTVNDMPDARYIIGRIENENTCLLNFIQFVERFSQQTWTQKVKDSQDPIKIFCGNDVPINYVWLYSLWYHRMILDVNAVLFNSFGYVGIGDKYVCEDTLDPNFQHIINTFENDHTATMFLEKLYAK